MAKDRDSQSNQASKPPSEAGLATFSTGTAFEAIAEINQYEKDFQKWESRGKQIVQRYRDERSEASNLRVVSRKFNILWSNTETLMPTLYARLPRVQVERRFRDADPIGRTACEIAERAGNYLLETSPFNFVQRLSVKDVLLVGRGTQWINYRADLSEVEGPTNSKDYGNATDSYSGKAVQHQKGGAEGVRQRPGDSGKGEREGQAGESQVELEKIKETIEPIYVDFRDFGHSPKRSWQEVTRVWRITFMTRKQLTDRFGDELGSKIPLDRKAQSIKETQPDTLRDTAAIYEIWDSRARKVCWVHKSEKDYLDESDPPVNLQDFFPCPRPLWSTMTNDTLVPVPLYTLYQDQAAELDKITNRIGRFSDGLKLVGIYDSSVPELGRLLSPNGTPDNMLVPVANYAGVAEKGGIPGTVSFIPLKEIAETLLSLYSARDQILNVIYQVTGLSDIIRGASNPNETATAQQIKGQYASLRIKDMQAEVARFSRDSARIIVEIAIEMFEPETLYEMVQADQFCQPTQREQQRAQLMQRFGMPPEKPMEQFNQALRMLRDDRMRSFHIDIETDSTIALDEQAEKEAVGEFFKAVGSFIQGFGPMIQEMPEMAPVAKEMLLYGVRRFKAGRGIETALEEAMDKITQKAAMPKPPPPEVQKVQAQIENDKQKARLQIAQGQQEIQQKAQSHAQDLQFKQAEHQMDLKANMAEHQITIQGKQAEHQQNMVAATQEHQHAMAAMQQRHDVELHALKQKAAQQPRMSVVK
jgi:hypothetical protein